ncbi:S8/S53 family peptidase [Aliiglaciecola sp. NS0011-25]|uniref:S8/S53 family peptidase n=1 Tax=Aliiglaciecola sp. NS0011-25 TaxID=3127654 RepID=UPI0031093F35
MYELTILNHEGEQITTTLYVFLKNGESIQLKDFRPFKIADVEEKDIDYIQIKAFALGFWRHAQNAPPSGATIRLQRIDQTGPLGWWHLAHGITSSDINRGQNIRIGVIDLCLEIDESLQHIKNLGQMDPQGQLKEMNIAEHPHGRYCCSLLANKQTEDGGFEGISPGSEIFFIGAMDETDVSRLNPLQVATAVLTLSRDYQCDIINISAGDLDKKPQFLLSVILQARKNGTVIVVAGGNDNKKLKYPAGFAEVVTAVALGKKGACPPSSPGYEHEQSQQAIDIDDTYYYWPNNDYGENVDYIAAGAGIIDTLDQTPNVDIYGTSYASPMLCGILAAKLSNNSTYHSCNRDISRVTLALDELRSTSIPLELGDNMKFNIPVL